MNDEQKEVLKTLLPYLLCTAALTIAFVLCVVRFGHVARTSSAPANIVTFDIIRYGNAQRAFASKFLTKQGDDDSTVLMNLSKKTHDSITKFAGGNTVILKQSVVQGDIPDITDDVLKDLGLPTNVPTQDPSTYTIDSAPTNFIIPQEVRSRQEIRANNAAGNSSSGALP
jgi:hypothetical protein